MPALVYAISQLHYIMYTCDICDNILLFAFVHILFTITLLTLYVNRRIIKTR